MDLTMASLLGAFHRLTSRRGACANIYSENSTNFVGANRYLDDFNKFLK